MVNIKPAGGPSSHVQLSQAVASLNSRLRASGMSSHELWTQRDQVSGEQLPLNDRELILEKYKQRTSNHKASERSKSAGKPPLPTPKVQIGTLVYIYSDKEKSKARNRYMVCGEGKDGLVQLRKFSCNLFSKEVYEVKPNDIYAVPEFHSDIPPVIVEDSSDDDMFYEEGDGENFNDEYDESSTSDEQEPDNLPTDIPDVLEHERPDPRQALPQPPLPPAELINEGDNNTPQEEDNTVQRYPRRASRRPPDKLGAIVYNDAQPLRGEDRVTAPWWPGYPRV